MSLRQKYLKILAGLLPAGAMGVSLALGTTALAAAEPEASGAAPAANQSRVSDRLAAIREAVSTVEGAKPAKPGVQVAWGAWGNGGGSRNGGAEWRNGGWGNGGWGNGPWGNGGWGNGPWGNGGWGNGGWQGDFWRNL
ncbi:MAG TPA: hypothetical protein VGI28_10620 [Stellaceae bacterium]|jgi:rSAM-associated Gly-rich repeat protein